MFSLYDTRQCKHLKSQTTPFSLLCTTVIESSLLSLCSISSSLCGLSLCSLPFSHYCDRLVGSRQLPAPRTHTVARLTAIAVAVLLPATLRSLPPPHHPCSQQRAGQHHLCQHSVAHHRQLEHSIEGCGGGRWQAAGRTVARRQCGVEWSVLPRLVRQVGHWSEADAVSVLQSRESWKAECRCSSGGGHEERPVRQRTA